MRQTTKFYKFGKNLKVQDLSDFKCKVSKKYSLSGIINRTIFATTDQSSTTDTGQRNNKKELRCI